ncbi:hypothetical protein [Marinobacter subterrani]|uniref:Uncharacterized protein n=1 Tax=Marinobacter subterrani TaxID=1658765 RepID=A0A0J7JBB4_9GAMM|nr:hypothetical protein [Marinobacter subterrani]KMQ75798.1 hypothetical protein Msub_12007 [Marinobacter subterrani]
MASEDENTSPGTAKPARIRKAACGIRFDEDELQEGIDFSNAAKLKPASDDTENAEKPMPSARDKHRKAHRNA